MKNCENVWLKFWRSKVLTEIKLFLILPNWKYLAPSFSLNSFKKLTVMPFCVSYFSGIYELYRGMQWHPTLVLLPRKSYGWRSLVDYSLWGREESDTTEQLHFHFSLSGIGEGNGNPLRWSCLEDPRDGGAWWAAVCGVTQRRTRLKWLSSSRIQWRTREPGMLQSMGSQRNTT